MRPNGHIRQRSPGSFELRYSFGTDDATGNRKVATSTIRGTRKDAEKELRRLLHAVDTGQHVDPSRVRVAEFVRGRIAQWEIAGKKPISAKTAERYRELVENQIVPQIGAKLLQKLRPADIERWQTTLRASGRKDGTGGISARTIGHVHRVLSKALRDAVRHGLVVKNVAAEEGAPEVDCEEIVIITDDRIKELLTKLADRPIYCRAIVALFTGVRRGELLAVR
jgi:integrase